MRQYIGTWQGQLTKDEQTHLKMMGITTLSAFQRNRAFQIRESLKMQEAHPYRSSEVCYECRSIAKKLHIEPEVN